MSYRRRNAGVICHDGNVFVVGGDDGVANLSNVEVSTQLFSLFVLHQIASHGSLLFLFSCRFTRQRRIRGAF